VLASAVSLGDVLSTPAAARLAPAYQTNGLTFHSDRGIGEALSRAVRLHLADGADRKGPVAVRLSGIALGAHLISRGDRDPGTPSGFVGAAAVLSGSSDESIGTTAAESGLKSAGSWALDESDAFSLEATARALR